MLDRVQRLRIDDEAFNRYYKSMQHKKKFSQTTNLLGMVTAAITFPYVAMIEYADNEFVQNGCLIYSGLIGFLATQYPRIISERFEEEIAETARALEFKLANEEMVNPEHLYSQHNSGKYE